MRTQMSFNGGESSVVFSLKEGKFYFYEKDWNELHNKYGGERFYSSKSGLSGAGFLAPDSDKNDLIAFGTYNKDCKRPKMVYPNIFGYVPIQKHQGIDGAMPLVLVCDNNVVFLNQDPQFIIHTILGWESIDWKLIQVPYYNEYGELRTTEFGFYNPNHMRGVNAAEFVSLGNAREVCKAVLELEENTRPTLVWRRLGIIKIKGKWFHVRNQRWLQGYFDKVWDTDPGSINGNIIAGWNGTGDGLFWRRCVHENLIQVFIEVNRSSQYKFEGSPDLMEYEENFHVVDWYSKPIDEWKSYFLAKITHKARMDWIYFKQSDRAAVKAFMEKNAGEKICIQDSLDAGNCRPGTEEFIKRYSILIDGYESVSIGELLKNPEIDKMVDSGLGKVIFYKLMKTLSSNPC